VKVEGMVKAAIEKFGKYSYFNIGGVEENDS
jgi:hypothetical protein